MGASGSGNIAPARLGAALKRLAPGSAEPRGVLDRTDQGVDGFDRFRVESRAVELDEMLRLTRFSIVGYMLVTASLATFFWGTPARSYVSTLCLCMWGLSLAALATGAIAGRRMASAKAIARGRFVATAFAFLIGIVWGTVPIALLSWSDDAHRLIVTNVMTGVIVGAFLLGPMLWVSLLFVLPVLIGSGIGLWLMGGVSGVCLLIILGVFAPLILLCVKAVTSLSVQRIVDRVKVSEQNETIGLLLRDFEENTSDWLWEINAEGIFRNVSERIAQAVGVPAAQIEHVPFQKIFTERLPGAPLSDGARKVFTAMAGRRAFHNMIVEIKTPGPSIWWRLTGKPIYDKGGTYVGYRGVGSDITVARYAEEKIAYMANYDALTGLANRAVFLNLASVECQAAAQDRTRRALLFLDLDGFKGVNDSLGHSVGDRLLKDVAERLKAMLPQKALLARLGGDEFAILCKVSHRTEAETLAQRLIERLSAPNLIDGLGAEIGLSVGLAFAPDDSIHPDALLVKADLALYRAKADGKGRYRVFVEEYERSLNDRRALESDLRLALPRGELELVYQPLVELGQGRVVCFEALLRWRSQARGMVSPVAFIPVAEAIGLIVPIGRWVLWQACTEAARWDADVAVAVNISPQHFRMPDFLNDVSVALELSGLAPTRLEIEITEGVFLDDCNAALENLHALRRRGIRIALDDFGTGYSSLSYLINFPVDKIKIDRSFVRDFVSRHENRAIIDAILALARELSISVTAEGVETVEQAVALRSRRCDDIQGYLLSVPRPASAVSDMIAKVPLVFRDVMPVRPQPPVAVVQKQTA